MATFFRPETLVPVAASDVELNVPTSLDIFDHDGRLFLAKGSFVAKLSTLERLCSEGFKYPVYNVGFTINESQPVFCRVGEISKQLQIIEQTLQRDGSLQSLNLKISALARSLIKCADEDSGSALARPYLDYRLSYSTLHHVMCGIVVGAMSRNFSQPISDRIALVSAAMTHDIGLLPIRKMLDNDNGYPGEQHEATMRDHPDLSHRVLLRSNIENSIWLTTVMDHHLHFDGSGFEGQGEVAPSWGSTLLAAAEGYTARLRPRPYRPRLLGPAVFSNLSRHSGSRYDPALLADLEAEFGVYHPGTIVKLASGDMGVVCHHHQDRPEAPTIALIASGSNAPMLQPYLIDGSASQNTIEQPLHPEVTIRFRAIINKAFGGKDD